MKIHLLPKSHKNNRNLLEGLSKLIWLKSSGVEKKFQIKVVDRLRTHTSHQTHLSPKMLPITKYL
jgi:hypothetical protein